MIGGAKSSVRWKRMRRRGQKNNSAPIENKNRSPEKADVANGKGRGKRSAADLIGGGVKMLKECTRYGSRNGTGAASLDIVILDIPLGREFSDDEIEADVKQRGLPERGAVREHLYALRNRGFIRRTDNGWIRIS